MSVATPDGSTSGSSDEMNITPRDRDVKEQRAKKLERELKQVYRELGIQAPIRGVGRRTDHYDYEEDNVFFDAAPEQADPKPQEKMNSGKNRRNIAKCRSTYLPSVLETPRTGFPRKPRDKGDTESDDHDSEDELFRPEVNQAVIGEPRKEKDFRMNIETIYEGVKGLTMSTLSEHNQVCSCQALPGVRAKDEE